MEGRLVHKRPEGRGSGRPSPKGKARALAASQSYRFVSKSALHLGGATTLGDHFTKPFDCPESGKARNPQAVIAIRPAGAPGEILAALEPAFAEFNLEHRSPGAAWLNLKQLHEPGSFGCRELTSTSRR